MVAFSCMYNGPLKGQFPSVSSCCMSSSIIPLLLIPHPRQSSFVYGIEYVLCIWKYLALYS